MDKFSRLALSILLLVLLTACGTTSTGGGSGIRNGEIAGNSWGTLSGPSVGSGTATRSNLRKSIAITLSASHPDLDLGTAYLTRYRELSDDPSLLLPVTNNGSKPLCFIKLTGVTYLSGETPVTSGDATTYVYGSVGRVAGDIYTNTCLASGETGYFLGISTEDALWSDVDNIEIDSLAASDTEVSGHAGKLVPTGYSTDASDDVSAVTAKNQGSVTLYPSLGVYFLLDESGEPLEWFILLAPESDSSIPGSSATWDAVPIFYEGSASGIRVHFDYSLDPPTASSAVQSTNQLSRAEWLERRDQRALSLDRSAGPVD